MSDNVEALAARLAIIILGLPYANAYAAAVEGLAGIDAPVGLGLTRTPGSVLNVRTYPGTERNGEAVPIAARLANGTAISIWQRRPDGWAFITFTPPNGQPGGGWVSSQFVEV